MSNLKVSGNRLSIFVFNILILVLSIVITTVYIANPFWRVKATVKLTKEQLTNIVNVEDYPNANLDLALEDGIVFHTDFAIPAELLWETNKEMLKSLVQEGHLNPNLNDLVTEFLGGQIDNVIDDMMPSLKDVAIDVAKSVAAEQTRQSVINSLTASTGNNDIAQTLDNAGYTDKWFSEQMDDLVIALQEGNKTSDGMVDIVMNTLNGIIDDLQSSEDSTVSSITDIDNETALRENLKEGLVPFENDQGFVDPNGAIETLLLNCLEFFISSEASSPTATPVSAEITVEDESTTQLRNDIKEKVYDILPQNVNDVISIFLKVSAGLLLFSIFTWLYVALKIAFKFFFKDNSVKLKMPLLFGCIPGLALWLVPTFACLFSKGTGVLQMVALHFASSGMWAFFASFALFIISIPYCSMRHVLKPRKPIF